MSLTGKELHILSFDDPNSTRDNKYKSGSSSTKEKLLSELESLQRGLVAGIYWK